MRNILNMEYLSQKAIHYIIKKGVIKEQYKEIYQYGFQCFLEVSISSIFSLAIGILLHMLPECLFFFILFIPLRSFNGGLHLNNYYSCFIFSALILFSSLMIIRIITIPTFISFIIYLTTMVLLIMVGPVDHPNRIVDSCENVAFMKKSKYCFSFSFIIALFFLFTNTAKYMLLQSIVFTFLLLTTYIGHILYKSS